MKPILHAALLLALSTPISAFAQAPTSSGDLPLNRANEAEFTGDLKGEANAAARLRAQVLLDRAYFGTGEIDARWGSNTERAIAAFQRSRNLEATGTMDEATWRALRADASPALVEYRLTAQDVAGPYATIPDDMMAKAALPQLGFTSVAESLGERFHASPALLAALNPGADLTREGTTLWVPNVQSAAPAKAASVVVDKSDASVMLRDDQQRVYARFPASTGSEHDPLPIGRWTIKGVARDPHFQYNPKLFWDADPGHAKAKIAPGPNNPVGVVWVDLSKDHYGIHGTPEPGKIGKTESHGCIRLTNWDATAVAAAVSPGTPALLQE
ncbi:L,D-transpeptidase family protein [Lysobacter soli]|uniref:L,D-transpeptidase family protein n=1 Tax=Lysobacter soli TaxID=453783 RepID=UPI0012EE366E|nr:L,D-transpeptidase [Lysobacter soli]QGW65190.1 L,D-transpeptidase family protein [Lysobacter soli]